MKNANEMPLYDAKRFMGITYPVLEAQLIYTAIELDLFKNLSAPITAEKLAETTGYHVRNLTLLLNALTATQYISKQGDAYQSRPETDYYLIPESEMYLGEHILYWRDMTNLENLTGLVKNGPSEITFSDQNGSDFFDFRSMGQGARNSMYIGRVQKFIGMVKQLFHENDTFSILDLGGGSGILSIELARNFKNAKAIVFDQSFVTEMTGRTIEEYGVSDQVQKQDGNFVTDDFGSGYDLIIASGIMDFVGDLAAMTKRLYHALNDNGILYVSTHGINESFTGPAQFVLGWLSSHLNGLDILKPDPVIRQAFADAGFVQVEMETAPNSLVLKKK